MSSTKKLSIIIPVFNQLDYTKQCLEAVWATTSPEFCEIIVIDDVSTDGTPEFLKSCGDRLRWVRNTENTKFARNCNKAARMAIGEFLVFLNNDTKPLPGWAKHALVHFGRDAKVGIVGSKLLYPNNTIQHAGVEFIKVPKTPFDFPFHRYRNQPSDYPEANRCEEVQCITGACLFIPRRLFFDLGCFAEDYGMYFEDIDLNMKAYFAGRKVIYEPKSVLYHYESKSNTVKMADEYMIKAFEIFNDRWESKYPEFFKKR